MTHSVWARGDVLIGGRWRRASARADVANPATEATMGTAAHAEPADVDAAVAAAHAALPEWAGMPPADRVAALSRLRAALAQRYELLVATIVAELGAPRRVAREAHVDTSLSILDGYLREAGELPWEQEIGHSLVLREPAGVAACITPWNYPLYQIVAKVVAALAAGCPVVLKPAELTPLSAYLFADATLDAGLPAGVVNLVPGAGRVVGEALVRHPDVAVVSFTGSTEVGTRVAALAAPTVKRVCLELGGKSASVLLDDADLVPAVQSTVDAAMLNSGQTCSAWTRLLVPRDRLAEALEVASAHASGLVVGDPEDEATDLGPLVSAGQRDTVRGYLDRAATAGARIAGRPAVPDRGFFLAPSVVSQVSPEAEVARCEVFGPVLCVLGYADEDEAVAIANGTEYGLAGAVWSADRTRALAVARRLRAGQIDINGAEFNPVAPFGGYARSGNGRELGRWGIEEFLETKAVQR